MSGDTITVSVAAAVKVTMWSNLEWRDISLVESASSGDRVVDDPSWMAIRSERGEAVRNGLTYDEFKSMDLLEDFPIEIQKLCQNTYKTTSTGIDSLRVYTTLADTEKKKQQSKAAKAKKQKQLVMSRPATKTRLGPGGK